MTVKMSPVFDMIPVSPESGLNYAINIRSQESRMHLSVCSKNNSTDIQNSSYKISYL